MTPTQRKQLAEKCIDEYRKVISLGLQQLIIDVELELCREELQTLKQEKTVQ